MSYALLWIEILLASLLWVAVADALAARLQRRWARVLILLIGLFVPGFILVTAAATTALWKFRVDIQTDWFAAALSLLTAYVIGVIVIRWRGRRRREEGLGAAAAAAAAAAAQWPLEQLALILLGAMALGTMTLWNMDLAALNNVAMMKVQAGTLMLAVTPPSVSDSQNAALLYEKAFARLAADQELAKFPAPEFDADVHDPSVTALLDRQAASIALLHEAAARPDCRFEHDYARPTISMLIPEINGGRLGSRLLILHARRELADGHVVQAANDIGASFRLSRNIGTGPWLVSSMVSIGIDANSIKAMEQLLPSVTRADQLAGLQIGDAETFRRLIRRGMQGEEALGLGAMADVATGTLSPSDIMGRGPDRDLFGATLVLFRVFLLPNDVNAYRELMETRERAAALPYVQARDQIREVEQRIMGHGILTNILAPALSRAYLNAALGEARHAGAEVAIAATRYRIDHAGQLPAKLDELVPTYLDVPPIDPFDGKPLRMSNKNGELLIYSIGPDQKDDAGGDYDPQAQTGDLTFHLRAPRSATAGKVEGT